MVEQKLVSKDYLDLCDRRISIRERRQRFSPEIDRNVSNNTEYHGQLIFCAISSTPLIVDKEVE